MNSSLIRNWNYDVSPSDIVLILGDLTFGPKHRPADYWLEKLNGQKFYLRGNHEIDPINKAVEIPNQYFIRFNQQTFMLTHKPLRPATWDSWIIHGHEHNNHPAHYPFINHSKKTINVSIEVIDYHPISINRIIQGITPTKSA